MFKTVLLNVAKRFWGVVASALVISAFSQYLHTQEISPAVLGLTLLVALAALLVTAVPLELHKQRKSRQG
jgi:hypothetical protein